MFFLPRTHDVHLGGKTDMLYSRVKVRESNAKHGSPAVSTRCPDPLDPVIGQNVLKNAWPSYIQIGFHIRSGAGFGHFKGTYRLKENQKYTHAHTHVLTTAIMLNMSLEQTVGSGVIK